jgi:hypothetical protein
MVLPRGLTAQVAFREALELAVKHSAASDAPVFRDQFDDACVGSSPSLLQSAVNLTLVDPRDLTTTQGTPSVFDLATRHLLVKSSTSLLTKSAAAESKTSVFLREDQRGRAVLCTAIAYANLANVNSQMEVLRRQQAAAVRLIHIQTRRVVREIEDPVLLTRAKLLEARTRMWNAALEGSALRLRRQLADLTGLTEKQIELVADSMAPLPDLSPADPEMQAAMRQVTAARDVAQLEHVLARTQRLSTRGKMVVGKANLGDLVAASIAEDEKLVALLEMNFAFERAKMQLLQASGRLEEWALEARQKSQSFTVAAPEKAVTAPTNMPVSVPERASTTPGVLSIMITPGVSKLLVGQSQQFSAIAIYNDGSAKNATSEATWRCSSNSDAIVSTSGLVTALAIGEVTITATVSGVSQPRRVEVAVDNSDPLLSQSVPDQGELPPAQRHAALWRNQVGIPTAKPPQNPAALPRNRLF